MKPASTPTFNPRIRVLSDKEKVWSDDVDYDLSDVGQWRAIHRTSSPKSKTYDNQNRSFADKNTRWQDFVPVPAYNS